MWAIVAIVLSVVSSIYSYRQMRKMQKKAKPEISQLDGSIADEGASFSDIAGSPHLYTNIVWIGDQSTSPIKVKQSKK